MNTNQKKFKRTMRARKRVQKRKTFDIQFKNALKRVVKGIKDKQALLDWVKKNKIN